MRQTYLAPTVPKAEFATERALAALGLQVWCGVVLTSKYRRKAKKWATQEAPALPGYLFVDLDDDEFHMLRRVKEQRPKWDGHSLKGLYPVLIPLNRADVRGFEAFRQAVDTAYAHACDRIARTEKPEIDYTAGQLLEIIGGPFAGLVDAYKGIEMIDGEWRILMEPEMLGARTPVYLSAGDVRAA